MIEVSERTINPLFIKFNENVMLEMIISVLK
jgi:hypothetical protein